MNNFLDLKHREFILKLMENQSSSPITQSPVSPQNEGVSVSNIVPATKEAGPKKKGILKYILIIVLFVAIMGGIFIAYNLWSSGEAGLPDITGELPKSGTKVVDDFSNGPLSTENWFPWTTKTETSSVEQVNGRLEIEIPSTSGVYNAGGVDTKVNITGDFEATVDLAIISGGVDSSETGLIFHDTDDNWPNRLSLFLRKEEDGTKLHAVSFVNGEQSYFGSRTYESSGPFTVKIKRSKGVATFSVLEGGDFEVIRTLTGFYTGGGYVTLHVNSFEPNYPAVFSTFDNFSLTLQ